MRRCKAEGLCGAPLAACAVADDDDDAASFGAFLSLFEMFGRCAMYSLDGSSTSALPFVVCVAIASMLLFLDFNESIVRNEGVVCIDAPSKT